MKGWGEQLYGYSIAIAKTCTFVIVTRATGRNINIWKKPSPIKTDLIYKYFTNIWGFFEQHCFSICTQLPLCGGMYNFLSGSGLQVF